MKYGSIDITQALSFQQMPGDKLKATSEYKDIFSFLVSATGLTPVEADDTVSYMAGSFPDHELTFTGSGKTFKVGTILAMLNPMVLLMEMQKQGLIPVAPIPLYKQKALPVPSTALGPIANSFGPLIPNFHPARRALLAPYAGHVQIGTHFRRPDGMWVLTAEMMDPTGVWIHLQ